MKESHTGLERVWKWIDFHKFFVCTLTLIFHWQCIMPQVQDLPCQSLCVCVFHSLRYGTSQCVACIPWQTKFPLCSSQHLPLLFLYFFHWKARHAFYLSDLKINIQHELILWIMSLLRYSCSYACILWCSSPLAFLLFFFFCLKGSCLVPVCHAHANRCTHKHAYTNVCLFSHPRFHGVYQAWKWAC